MYDKLRECIDNLIGEIYTVDQTYFNQKFLLFLDTLDDLLEWLSKIGFDVSIQDEMSQIQRVFEKKDMEGLADYLLYDFKPVLFQLEEMTKEVTMEEKQC